MWGRIRQTLQALTAFFRPVDDGLAEKYLSTSQLALFKRMSRAERQHHLRVLKKLLKRGQTHPALLVAALLHDVGKTQTRFTLIERILAVLVKKFLPERFVQWSRHTPTGWRRAFVVSACHPAWGAAMADAAGSDPLALALIRHHQDKLQVVPRDEFENLLAALQAADDIS